MSRKVCAIGIRHTDFNSITPDIQWKDIMHEVCNNLSYINSIDCLSNSTLIKLNISLK